MQDLKSWRSECPRPTLHSKNVVLSQDLLQPLPGVPLCSHPAKMLKILGEEGQQPGTEMSTAAPASPPNSLAKARKPGTHSYHCLRIFNTLAKTIHWFRLETAWYKK